MRGTFYAIIIEMKLGFFILTIVCGYIFLATIFSIIYYIGGLTSSNSFLDNLYFSLITQTTISYGDILPKPVLGRFIASMQAIIGMFYTSIFIAILLYKLIKISPNVMIFEKYAVFSPEDCTLRIRAVNLFKLQLIDVNVNMYLRVWLEKAKRYATYDINLKRNNLPYMDPKAVWRLATQSLDSTNEYDITLEELDTSRKIVFLPQYVKRKYIPEDAIDKTMLRLQVKAEIPLFGTNLTISKSYKHNEILCGRYQDISLESGLQKWDNWGKIIKSSTKDCENCIFKKFGCEIDTEKKKLHPWTRFIQHK